MRLRLRKFLVFPYSSGVKLRLKLRNVLFNAGEQFLWKYGFDWRRALSPGISVFGFDYFRAIHFRNSFAGKEALAALKSFSFDSVLDVGAGSGIHSKIFRDDKKLVTAIDLGYSKYYLQRWENFTEVEVINSDFLSTEFGARKWDLVWASHVLEHQRNPGAFIDKLISVTNNDGFICITLPNPHRTLWGGHLSIWSPGLLLYHLALAGLDVSNSRIIFGNREFSVIFRKNLNSNFPQDLTYDSGDVDKLRTGLPKWVFEAADPWNVF